KRALGCRKGKPDCLALLPVAGILPHRREQGARTRTPCSLGGAVAVTDLANHQRPTGPLRLTTDLQAARPWRQPRAEGFQSLTQWFHRVDGDLVPKLFPSF